MLASRIQVIETAVSRIQQQRTRAVAGEGLGRTQVRRAIGVAPEFQHGVILDHQHTAPGAPDRLQGRALRGGDAVASGPERGESGRQHQRALRGVEIEEGEPAFPDQDQVVVAIQGHGILTAPEHLGDLAVLSPETVHRAGGGEVAQVALLPVQPVQAPAGAGEEVPDRLQAVPAEAQEQADGPHLLRLFVAEEGMQVGPAEIGAHSAKGLGSEQDRILKIRAGEDGPPQQGPRQIAPTQLRPGQVGAAQVRLAQVDPAQVRIPERDPAQLDARPKDMAVDEDGGPAMLADFPAASRRGQSRSRFGGFLRHRLALRSASAKPGHPCQQPEDDPETPGF